MIYQSPLPDLYHSTPESDLLQRVHAAKKKLGKRAIILAHHYQRPEIVSLSDYRGDSLKLAQFAAAQDEADYVVYCGVHFMAESADILKKKDQIVILPDLGAGCDMADMADADDVDEAWIELTEFLGNEDILPVTYINSTAALKAFVATKRGVVCTSTNAGPIIKWAFSKQSRLFFFPDQHLGRNTCKKLGIPLEQIVLWDPKKKLGGLTPDQITKAKVFLWKGHCPVHMMFASHQIDKILQKDPEFKIISHPECSMEVVDKSEFVGSTEYIVKTIAESKSGSKWAVGTEMNLVNRIASENLDKTIISINPYMCLCGTMNRIDVPHLAWALDQILANTPQNIISVADPVRSLAKESLQRMLELS